MSQHRKCPSCGVPLPIGSGVVFDKDNAVICESCGKPIIATTHVGQNIIVPPVTHFGAKNNPYYGDCPGGTAVSPKATKHRPPHGGVRNPNTDIIDRRPGRCAAHMPGGGL